LFVQVRYQQKVEQKENGTSSLYAVGVAARAAIASKMKTLGSLASRVVIGTGIYVVIIALAAPLPTAAGLMLTFPALNGLAFYFSEDERATAVAKTMLWMPIVNGALCAAYILLFVFLAEATSPTAVGWSLLPIAAVLWYAWVSRDHVRAGIDPSLQLRFAIAATLVGGVLAAATLLVFAHLGVSPPRIASAFDSADHGHIVDAIARGKLKIALFALTLWVLVAGIQYFPISDSTRGILAGLPVVPFGGLVSVAGDASIGADARRAAFLGMIASVWLGPPIAVWYILVVSRYLKARKRTSAQALESLFRFGALVVAWLATFGVIVAVASAIATLSAGGATLHFAE
jgi:hypothetical protein